jgi:hypothetical protein
MSQFIHLDSVYRDRITYPNPADYELTPSQVATWFPEARDIKANPQNTNTKALEFATDINIQLMTLPYDPALLSFPVLYVDFHSRIYDDRFLIASIDGTQSNARFICVLDKVQNDSTGTPVWCHYKSSIRQALRFKRNDSVVFRVTTRNGTVLPFWIDADPALSADPTKQSLLTLELVPYLRDGRYINHNVETQVTT